MPKRARGWRRTIVIVAIGSVIAAAMTGCETSEPADPTPLPTVLGPDTPPPVTPPWTMAQLVNHPCTVLGPDDLARLGFADPGKPSSSGGHYCQWLTPAANPRQVRMYFGPDYRQRFGALEDLNRTEENFRSLAVAGRPAFLVDDHSDSGHRNCRIWVSVASGGLFQFEFAPANPYPDWDFCATAVEIAAVIAGRLQ
ncbi:hypothetical protein GCM10011610_68040 [Nocardia rhizosphaerihabitans]|uniref:DUF3558 domain-containing protein n=1 Tax=Nocardia rhizosphaerihabitans TaxID=1691570 RepID=A0ABQ2L1Q6_9NOCA|nr:hypothetical protein GCM10011610_68040 [Nocardia rhizosphaerihabitans]